MHFVMNPIRLDRRIHLLIGGVLAATLGAAVLVPRFANADDSRPSIPAAAISGLGGDAAQQSMLSDGAVTNPEYEAAVAATVACIRNAGIAVTEPVWRDGQLHYTSGPFASKEALDAAKPTLESCYDQHLRGVDVLRAAGQ